MLSEAQATTLPNAVDLRTALQERLAEDIADFWSGASITDLLHRRAQSVDSVLISLWSGCAIPGDCAALVAVGGYGRGELHPNSDIDLLVLVETGHTDAYKVALEQFITQLWDLGLEIGHAVREVPECVTQARDDVTVMTNLMESRLLAGAEPLYAALTAAVAPGKIWSIGDFFSAKRNEQVARHRRHGDAARRLEPNVKESPGGLRDLQTITWVAQRHFGTVDLRELMQANFLTEDELASLEECRLLLWRFRYALHALAGRSEDRLLFEYQRSIASAFGYEDAGQPNRAVEQLMRRYYQCTNELQQLNEMLLQLFDEAFLQRGKVAWIRPLNNRFQAHNDLIEAREPDVFEKYPFAILELFLLLQQNPDLNGVRAETSRSLRDARDLIDDDFRADLRNRSLFMEIIRQPRRLGHELHRMLRYGVLGRYLPAFEVVAGLMQFDMFHVYTVDEHTLRVIRNMRRFLFPTGDEPELCVELIKSLPKTELLYLAGLFHDLAKGRNGDHSELGAEDAEDFCRDHQLSVFDTRLVVWLVRNHLLMSMTAQRKDTSDPLVIREFADLVGDKTHLDYLYLLTCADIRGTNPTLWTSWKDRLLKDLYFSTLRALRRGAGNPISRAESAAENRGEALALLCRTDGFSAIELDRCWDSLPEDYFLRHTPDEISWQALIAQGTRPEDLPVVKLREESPRGGTEIFIYAHEYLGSFAATVSTLDRLGLTILDARIITSQDGFSFDTYTVLDSVSDEVIRDPARIAQISSQLVEALKHPGCSNVEHLPRPPRHLRSFNSPARVSIDTDGPEENAVMEIIATDRPGLLAVIGDILCEAEMRVVNARIATFGERAEDILELADPSGALLEDATTRETLCRELEQAIDAHLEQLADTGRPAN